MIYSRVRTAKWMYHTGSIEVTKYNYKAHPMPKSFQCPQQCAYRGGVFKGPITCERSHGLKKKQSVEHKFCVNTGLSPIAPITTKCP